MEGLGSMFLVLILVLTVVLLWVRSFFLKWLYYIFIVNWMSVPS